MKIFDYSLIAPRRTAIALAAALALSIVPSAPARAQSPAASSNAMTMASPPPVAEPSLMSPVVQYFAD
jgi:hypothetical protein